MNDAEYATHCLAQLRAFSKEFTQRTAHLPEGDTLRELAGSFSALAESGQDLYAEGPALVSRLFTTYPDFAPTFPRLLLWFLAGECLHYMPDEEIANWQQVDEMRHEAAAQGKVLDITQARSSLQSLQ